MINNQQRRFAFFLLFLLLSFFAFAQNAKIDSLERALPTSQDSTKLKILVELCWQYRNLQSDKAIGYGKQAIELATQIKNDKLKAKSYTYLCFIYTTKGDYATALTMCQESNKIGEQIQDKEEIGYALQNLGDINSKLGNYKQALEYTLNGLQAFEAIGNLRGMAFCYLTLGNIHTTEKDFRKAYYYYEKALKVREEEKDANGIATAKGLMGITLAKQKLYKDALVLMFEANAFYAKQGNKRNLANTFSGIAQAYLGQNKLDSAVFYANQSIDIAQKTGQKQVIRECSETLAQVYALKKDFTQAYAYQQKFIVYNDSIFNEEKNRQFQELESRYQNEKQKHEIDFLKLDNQRKNLLNSIFIGGFVLVLGLFFALWRGNRTKRKAHILLKAQHHQIQEKSGKLLELNEELNQTNEELNANLELLNQKNTEIQQKNEIIEKKNKDVADSIAYAQRIQFAILPNVNDLKKHLRDCFVLFKPRDVVSGDFYWIAEKGNKLLLAVADCTGHGVPGAFMSMIANDLLNLIVHEKEIHEVDLILMEMSKLVRKALKQDENGSRDGLDIAICCINSEKRTLEYAGAMNPLYFINIENSPQLIEIKADKMPIGGYELKDEKFFTKHTIELGMKNVKSGIEIQQLPVNNQQQIISNKQETVFYLFSDGYADQFGGEHGKKFMVRRFKELLLSIHHEPMEKQQEVLEATLTQWMGNEKQIDDITVLGIKI